MKELINREKCSIMVEVKKINEIILPIKLVCQSRRGRN